MKRTIILAASTCIAMLLASCKGPEVQGEKVGEYTQSLISDTTQNAYQIISLSRNKNIQGNIAVIGEPEFTLLVSENLVKSDMFDNINGKLNPDGLPDFAGETICPTLDSFNSPYASFLTAGKEDALSGVNVYNFVAALDTACYLNAYDTEKILHKSRAKLVVLSSLYSSSYGKKDIDTLRVLTNSRVQIVAPVNAMLDQAWELCGNGLNLGVWTSKNILESGIYPEAIEDEKDSRKDLAASYAVIAPDTASTVAGRFLDFMKQYSASGDAVKKLSAIVVDDMSVPVDELREAVKSVMAVDQDRYLTYLNYMSPDLKVIDLREAVATACYRILRSQNIFTHKIAYPQVKLYVTTASERDKSYVTLELKDKYLPEDLRQFMITNTPNIFAEYVR